VIVRPSWFDKLTMRALALTLRSRRRRRLEGRSLAQDEGLMSFHKERLLILSKGR